MNTKPIGRKCVVAVIVLSFLFIFSACAVKGSDVPAANVAENEIEHEANPEVFETEPLPDIPACPEECEADIQELNGCFNENGWLKVLTFSGPVIPYEYRPVGEILYGDGSIKEEGLPLSSFLPGIYDELPVADRSQGFDLDIYEWGMAYLIDVFGSDSEMLAHGIDTRELMRLAREHNEELIVDVHIVVTGCEVDEWPEERCGMGYAFILSAADHEVSAPSGEEPFLRLYYNGKEVGTHKFFMYGASACYGDDGVPVGMLSADGEAFFDPDHIAGAYEELPVYDGSRADGLDIRLVEGAEIRSICVYVPANGFERIELANFAALDRLIVSSNKEYVVEIVVYRQGNYIEALDEYEYAAYGYAFVIK